MSGAFGVAYLYTTELFPTQVRNQALGVASIGARLGGILSPIVIMTVSSTITIELHNTNGLSFSDLK